MNTANKLTLARVVMIPVFIMFAVIDLAWCRYAALVLFIAASLTDFADGKIARKYNMITDFGKFMDPLADKLLVTAALCVLVSQQRISVWVLFIITVREFIVTGLRLIAAGNGTVIAASMWGKAKTMLQLIVITVALLPISTLHFVPIAGQSVIWWAMWIVAAVTVISGFDYIFKNKDIFKNNM